MVGSHDFGVYLDHLTQFENHDFKQDEKSALV